MARKRSNRWIEVIVWDNQKRKFSYLYFKTLEEVADFYGAPNKQYISDIIHKRRNGYGKLNGTDIKYVNKDITSEQLEISNQLKAQIQHEITQYLERRDFERNYNKNIYATYSKDYWTGRMKRAQLFTDMNIENLEEEYRKIFQDARYKLDHEIELTQFYISYPDRKIKPLTRTDVYNMKRYQMASAQLSLLINDMGEKMQKATRKYLEDTYKQVSKEIAGSAEMFFQIDERKLKLVVDEVWCADGLNWSKRIWKSQTLLKEKLKEGLVDCLVKGYNSYKTAQELTKAFNVSYSNAKRLASTELAHIETIAAQQRYKSYGITEWEVLATHDEKTCPICQGKDGKKFSIDEVPVPLHPNCRCAMIPVVEF